MANKKVVLVRKCKTPNGWKRYPVVMGANGRLKRDAVLVDGFEMVYPTGHYELRSYVGSKLTYTRVKSMDPADALAAWKTATKQAHAVAAAQDADVQVVLDDKRTSLPDARKKFVEAAVARGANEAAEIYKRTLDDFFLRCTKQYADQLTHDDVVAFHASMRQRGLSDRTVKNRHMNLRSFVLYLGLDAKTVCGRTPDYEEQAVSIYEREQLSTFFKALTNDYDRLLFDVLLTCGLRERELVHLEWRSINWSAKTLRVRSNPKYGFKVKDHEQRDVPIQEDVLLSLEGRRNLYPDHKLVFGAKEGTFDEPEGHLLRRLKTIVRNAGLNCGHCETCDRNKECSDWFLHKFRATYITTLLRNNMDLRTVMKLSGHADLASVMRYLRPAEGKDVQDKVNAIRWR